MKFSTTLLLGGKTATGIHVPDEVVAALGAGKRPAVKATIGGHTYRSTIAVMDGRFMLPVSAENRAAAGIAAGDTVEVELELDQEPREVSLPADFEAALRADAEAQRFFEGLSYSQRKWTVADVETAKTQATRERRITQAVQRLHEGRPR